MWGNLVSYGKTTKAFLPRRSTSGHAESCLAASCLPCHNPRWDVPPSRVSPCPPGLGRTCTALVATPCRVPISDVTPAVPRRNRRILAIRTMPALPRGNSPRHATPGQVTPRLAAPCLPSPARTNRVTPKRFMWYHALTSLPCIDSPIHPRRTNAGHASSCLPRHASWESSTLTLGDRDGRLDVRADCFHLLRPLRRHLPGAKIRRLKILHGLLSRH
jgi:hypothetical protein